MKVVVISYSLTGNNEKLATSIALNLKAKQIKIEEKSKRTIPKIIIDMLFNLTPKIDFNILDISKKDFIIFVSPVWMGKVAAPLRKCFKDLKNRSNDYAFISISGGADGPNPKLSSELKKRLGWEPKQVIDLHIKDLLPKKPKPTREDTSNYKLSNEDIKKLTIKVTKILEQKVYE